MTARLLTAIFLVFLAAPALAQSGTDEFGIAQIYPTASNGSTWTSRHWANGNARIVVGKDPGDPTRVSESRGDRAEVFIDGKGAMQFRGSIEGSEPRLHLNGVPGTFFKNVEITFYYMKEKDFDVNWAGMVVGARSGPDGHTNQVCDAHTYYGRFRNDGKYDFEKELKHPGSAVRNSTNMWNGATDLPAGKWIGMKFIVRNVTVGDKKGVKLELYRDLKGGEGGGNWKKIGETVDTGGWAPPQNGGSCTNLAPDYVPTKGGGVVILRNTGVVSASYKWMTVREIASR